MNLPNILTVLRMFMVPLFPILYFSAGPLWGLGIYLAASLTDILDGYLARRFNQVTNFGKLMDPLADKLMLLTALICFVVAKVMPLWALVIILAKEALMVVGGLVLVKSRGIITPADAVGKVCTLMFGVAIVAKTLMPEVTMLLSHALAVAGGCFFIGYALVLSPTKWEKLTSFKNVLSWVSIAFFAGAIFALFVPGMNPFVALADIFMGLALLLALVSFVHYVRVNWVKITQTLQRGAAQP